MHMLKCNKSALKTYRLCMYYFLNKTRTKDYTRLLVEDLIYSKVLIYLTCLVYYIALVLLHSSCTSFGFNDLTIILK